MKASGPRKELDRITSRIAELRQQERRLVMEAQQAVRHRDDVRERLTAAIADGAVAVDGTTDDPEIKRLHTALAKAEEAIRSGRSDAERDGLRRARDRMETERLRLCREHFADLVGDLVTEAQALHEDVRKVAELVAEVQGRWGLHAQAWDALERQSEIGRQVRLTTPPFPIELGDTSVSPIPRALTDAQAILLPAEEEAAA